MITRPLFSIIIPTYNRSNTLERALSSLVKQTLKDFEVIITDDGSTDSTYDVIQSFSSLLHIIYNKIPNSGGPAKPRNHAITFSSGIYIAFLDSDDSWLPSKLEVCLSRLSKGYQFVYHDAFQCYDSFPFIFSKHNLKSLQVTSPVFEYLINHGNPIFNSSVVVTRQLLDCALPIDEHVDLIAAEDFDFWLRISQFSDSFSHIALPLMNYHIANDNISSYQRKYSFTRYLCRKYNFPISQPSVLPYWALHNLATTSFKLNHYHDASLYCFAILKRRPPKIMTSFKFFLLLLSSRFLSLFS